MNKKVAQMVILAVIIGYSQSIYSQSFKFYDNKKELLQQKGIRVDEIPTRISVTPLSYTDKLVLTYARGNKALASRKFEGSLELSEFKFAEWVQKKVPEVTPNDRLLVSIVDEKYRREVVATFQFYE